MTAIELFQIFEGWKNTTYLKECSLVFDNDIYSKALETFLYDYKKWFPNDDCVDRQKLLLTPQLHGILAYRIASLWYRSLDTPTNTLAQQDIVSNIGRINSLSEIYYSANIGQGLKINHGIGTVIGARCVIGNDCIIHQNVTFGDKHSGRPILGDNCIVYAGAMIIGNITIGNNCIIGANSVVMDSFPDESVIAGCPARKIK